MKKIISVILAIAMIFSLSSFAFAEHVHDFVAEKTVKATCTSRGYTVYKCRNCTTEKYDDFTGALGHTPIPAREENKVEPSCKYFGSYDLVVRCSRCSIALETTKVDVEKTEHIDKNDDGYCDICGEECGEHVYKCICPCHEPTIIGIFYSITRTILVAFIGEKGACCDDFGGFSPDRIKGMFGNGIDLSGIDFGEIFGALGGIFG